MEELISECVCGGNNFISFFRFDYVSTIKNPVQIMVNECFSCGIKHQRIQLSYKEYMNLYRKAYSCFEGKDGGQLVSSERYDHDYRLAVKRYENYKEYIPKGSKLLDIGSGNGAFTDFMNNWGYCKVKALEFCENYKGHKIDYKGDFLELELRGLRFDVITMHDVLEHLVRPREALDKCYSILENKGILIIDFPDFFHPEGLHHWKYLEHLWMFKKNQLIAILESAGFSILDIKKPIPSKLVFYASKTQA